MNELYEPLFSAGIDSCKYAYNKPDQLNAEAKEFVKKELLPILIQRAKQKRPQYTTTRTALMPDNADFCLMDVISVLRREGFKVQLYARVGDSDITISGWAEKSKWWQFWK